MIRLLILLLASVVLAGDIPLQAPILLTHRVQVRWAANTELDLAGYRVYQTLADRTFWIDVGPDTSAIIDLSAVMTKVIERVSIMVTAYDDSENESEFSETVTLPVVRDTTNYLFGDLDGNGRVSVIDHALFVRAFGSSLGDSVYTALADINVDGNVAVLEHMAFSINFGQVK